MKFVTNINDRDLSSYSKNWGWFLGWGIALSLLGIVAISTAAFTTLLSVIILGMICFISGLFVIFNGVQYRSYAKGEFFYNLLVGLLYLILGILLMVGPVGAAIGLTLLLGVFFIIVGLSRLIFSFTYRFPHWGFSALSGLLALLLGILIIAEWPASGLIIIGLFIGIDLLFLGWTYIMVAVFAKGLQKQP